MDLGVAGTCDIINLQSITELKFAKELHPQYYCQLLMYAILSGPCRAEQGVYSARRPLFLNIRTGELLALTLNQEYMAKFIHILIQYMKPKRHVIRARRTDCFEFYDVTLRCAVSA